MTNPLRAARCLLFVPGDRADRFAKAEASGADGAILDLEDAVAPERKDAARAAVLAHLRAGGEPPALLMVRTNPAATPHGLRDLLALIDARIAPPALVLPKVEDAGEVRLVAQALAAAGLSPALLAIVESARGLENAPAIAAAAPTLAGLAFGGVDLAADLGAALAWDAMAYARGRVVAAAAAAGLPAFDVPFLAIADDAGLAQDCAASRRFGFAGKIAIHPRQVAAIQAAFAPSAEEIARAERVLAASAAAQGGVAVVDGRMIDAPVVRAAERIVALAARKGMSTQ